MAERRILTWSDVEPATSSDFAVSRPSSVEGGRPNTRPTLERAAAVPPPVSTVSPAAAVAVAVAPVTPLRPGPASSSTPASQSLATTPASASSSSSTPTLSGIALDTPPSTRTTPVSASPRAGAPSPKSPAVPSPRTPHRSPHTPRSPRQARSASATPSGSSGDLASGNSPGSGSAAGSAASARTRSSPRSPKFTPVQLEALRAYFDADPLPNSAQRKHIAEQLGLSESTVRTWFQNQRARTKPAPAASPELPDSLVLDMLRSMQQARRASGANPRVRSTD